MISTPLLFSFVCLFSLGFLFYLPALHPTGVERESLLHWIVCWCTRAIILFGWLYTPNHSCQESALHYPPVCCEAAAAAAAAPPPPLKEHHYSKSRANFPLTEKSAKKKESKKSLLITLKLHPELPAVTVQFSSSFPPYLAFPASKKED